MELGAFSVSLNVADLGASRRFYEALGFTPFHGDASQGWLILRNWLDRDRAVPGDARAQHADVQSRLGR